MELHIKNMVCDRCIAAVKRQLEQDGLTIESLRLGEAKVTEMLNAEQLQGLHGRLKALGFELVDDRRAQLVEKVKAFVLSAVRGEKRSAVNLSLQLAEHVGLDYKYISQIFSQAEGKTIERYAIAQRIAYAEELLEYGEMNINEIAYRLGYAGAPQLTRQFKQVTGMTPSEYRQQRPERSTLDKL